MGTSAAAEAPLGATVVPGGATFCVWAPSAAAVHLGLGSGGAPAMPAGWAPSAANLLTRDGRNGCWSGFVPGAADGDRYRFWVAGAPGETGPKRDPRARELEIQGYPDCDCILRGPNAYPWHDTGFRPPPFNDLIIYQLHIGVFYATQGSHDIRKNRVSKFLDVLGRIEHLAALGVNAILCLPVVEWQGQHSRGYNNTDFFSPEMDYALRPEELTPYLARINALLRRKGLAELRRQDLLGQGDQLKAMVDLCHAYGLAVLVDLVFNHAGGPFDDQSMRFLDRPHDKQWWDPDSYFIAGDGWAGGRIFDYARDEVRQFLIDNAALLLDEYHVDGFRYDEVSVISNNGGDRFCRDLTATLRFRRPEAIHIAEYWNWDRAKPVTAGSAGGLGFDAALHDGLRGAVRAALGAASGGALARVDMDGIRDALRRPKGFPTAWRAVIHLENHDLVDADREGGVPEAPRIAALANPRDHRDWCARSRARVATGILLTAPGIPMLFMGEEFLEDKPWHNDPSRDELFLYWAGISEPGPMRDFVRFTAELCALRARHSALRGEGLNPYYSHIDDRVLAYQRWVEGVGRDVIVVATLAEATRWDYELPLPVGGHWHEVFNSDAYDSLPEGDGYNPWAAGNPGGVDADGPPRMGCPTSARLVLPANGLLVLARDLGD